MFSDIIDGFKSAITAVFTWVFDIFESVGALGFIFFFIVLFVFTVRVLSIPANQNNGSGLGSDKARNPITNTFSNSGKLHLNGTFKGKYY